jgi:subtilisin family serine protease
MIGSSVLRRPGRHADRRRLVALRAATLGTLTAAALLAPSVAPSPDTAMAARPKKAVTLNNRQIVVKLRPGIGVAAINARYGTRTASVLLASHRVYLLEIPADAAAKDPKKAAEQTAKAIARDSRVAFSEVNKAADSAQDERFHHWPRGGPTCTGSDPARYADQPAVADLELGRAHRVATGAGSVVAVLDTGVAIRHPALAPRIAPGGYDYVSDDRWPGEVADGVDQDGDGLTDEGYGHGTFVAGIAALVAPDARILPMRVLDSEGRGNVFVVAEAIFDAVDAGADVLNLSFGTAARVDSALLRDALHDATKAGVVVVAAAGNDGSSGQHFPAAAAGVVSVGAMNAAETHLAWFSARGPWVDLAAPGVDITSTLPCGYGSWSGTSMATPFVSGAAALLGERWGTSAKSDRARRLQDGADKMHGTDVRSGVVDVVRSLER